MGVCVNHTVEYGRALAYGYVIENNAVLYGGASGYLYAAADDGIDNGAIYFTALGYLRISYNRAVAYVMGRICVASGVYSP